MDIASFSTGLLTGLHEGVVASLLVGISLAYLARTGNADHFDTIWFGVGAAVALSLGLGAVVFATSGRFEGVAEDLFEGIAMLAAAAVVTWMVFRMRRTAMTTRHGIQAANDSALVEGSIFGLTVLAFTSVLREGIETAVFLLDRGTAAALDPSALSVLLGAVIGIGIAIAIGIALYRGAHVVTRRTFFMAAGIALVFIGAGLLSHAINEFVEAGWITVGTASAFDISGVLPHRASEGSGLGAIGWILRASFGYSSSPEWITFLTWLGYVAVVLTLFLRPRRPAPAEGRPPERRARFGSRPSSEDLATAA